METNLCSLCRKEESEHKYNMHAYQSRTIHAVNLPPGQPLITRKQQKSRQKPTGAQQASPQNQHVIQRAYPEPESIEVVEPSIEYDQDHEQEQNSYTDHAYDEIGCILDGVVVSWKLNHRGRPSGLIRIDKYGREKSALWFCEELVVSEGEIRVGVKVRFLVSESRIDSGLLTATEVEIYL